MTEPEHQKLRRLLLKPSVELESRIKSLEETVAELKQEVKVLRWDADSLRQRAMG